MHKSVYWQHIVDAKEQSHQKSAIPLRHRPGITDRGKMTKDSYRVDRRPCRIRAATFMNSCESSCRHSTAQSSDNMTCVSKLKAKREDNRVDILWDHTDPLPRFSYQQKNSWSSFGTHNSSDSSPQKYYSSSFPMDEAGCRGRQVTADQCEKQNM